MNSPHRTRLVNPRLGTYFGIFASALVAMFLVILILEQLAVAGKQLRLAAFLGTLLLFAAIGIASFTNNPAEYFAAGRRVPAVYNGLAFAMNALAGTGLVVLTGLFFINGFDAWFLAIGLSSGFLVMGIAISPYFRKYGAYTVPSYLARRLESRLIRVLSASIFAVPLLLLLAAELSIAIKMGELLTGLSSHTLAGLFAVALCASIVFGGMRALGWVSTAQGICAIVAIIVVAGTIGVLLTNLPLAQLSHGPVLRQIGRLEEARQIVSPTRDMFEFALAGPQLQPLTAQMAQPFGSVGWGAFIVSSVVVMLGIAGAPWLLPRCATTLGVYEARKSLGWAIFFVGVFILTLSSIAVFLRSIVMNDLVGLTTGQLPKWFVELSNKGLASVAAQAAELPMSSFQFARDGVLYAIPLALDFPLAFQQLLLAGAVAAALAGVTATAFALSAILSEDVFSGLNWTPPSDSVRINTARVMVVLVIGIGVLFNTTVHFDPLDLFLTALSLSAATSFPVIVLSIWWKRLSPMGAAASMLVGFIGCIILMLGNSSGVAPIATPVAGLISCILAIAAALITTLLTPGPSIAALDAARDMRIPGGETVYDREMRQLRFSQRDQD